MVLGPTAMPALELLLRSRGHGAELVDLDLAIRRAIGMKDIVVPDDRWTLRVRLLPGIPREIGLRLSEYEAPVDHADVQAAADGQRAVEGRAGAACQVLGADEGPAVRLQLRNAPLEHLGPVVHMERDHV